MILYPNCKINLGLRVIRKRKDGYHDLETVFVPVYGLHDELEVTKSTDRYTERNNRAARLRIQNTDPITFAQEGIAVDCPAEDNLIVKCYRLMAARYPQIGPVTVRFQKNIPFGAGLGGGSSDAAHMAIALNEIFELGLSKEQLAAEVAPLGADCAFFIYNTPCLAEGIGERLTPVPFTLSGFRLLMLKPDIHISTREAYAGIRLSSDQPSLAELVRKGITPIDLSRHADIIYNDFERTVFPLHPELADIKKRLQDAGAYYAAMSGSGSTVYALFEDNAERGSLADDGLMDEDLAAMVLFNDTLA